MGKKDNFTAKKQEQLIYNLKLFCLTYVYVM